MNGNDTGSVLKDSNLYTFFSIFHGNLKRIFFCFTNTSLKDIIKRYANEHPEHLMKNIHGTFQHQFMYEQFFASFNLENLKKTHKLLGKLFPHSVGVCTKKWKCTCWKILFTVTLLRASYNSFKNLRVTEKRLTFAEKRKRDFSRGIISSIKSPSMHLN